jgi:signal transduction histidine kinase
MLSVSRFIVDGADANERAPDIWSVVLVVLIAMPLIWSVRHPMSALVAASVPAVVYAVALYPPTVVFLAPMICLYRVGLIGERARTVIVGLLAAGVVAGVVAVHGPTPFRLGTLASVALIAFPLAVGDAVQSRRAYVAELKHRLSEAEHSRDEEARRRVQQERLRIARDLHDVLAHTISTVNIQAGVAAHLVAKDPARAEPALRAIKEASRDALAELRGLLGILRSDDASGDAPLQPAPGVDAIGPLVDELRSGGIDIACHFTGDAPIGLPEPVQLAAYRIVQEACTNAVRHADAAPTQVDITYQPTDLEVHVRNLAPRTRANVASRGTGVGIEGMRERATLVGGTLHADETPDGGFEVVAHLPYRTGT